MERKWIPTVAELIDRLSIHQLKEVLIPENKEKYSKEDEQGLILKGYIAFFDPPKPTAKKTIETLKNLGIDFKVLTGDKI